MSTDSDAEYGGSLAEEIFIYYQRFDEAERLNKGYGRLEKARTKDLLERFLPAPPGAVLDVGGGSGIYACFLARRGYEVHLVDPVPRHVEQALQASREQPTYPLAGVEVGDARTLDREDESVDVVLLFGPLYHLTKRDERLSALSEAYRVLRPGGSVHAVGISRFASTLQGIALGMLADPVFAAIAARDRLEGQHRNPTEIKSYFTTAFFHHPGELAEELEAAGFVHDRSLAVEGPGWLLQDFDEQWEQPDSRARLLSILRELESEPTMLGVSAHIMAIGRKVAG